MDNTGSKFDIVIIGGGFAGLTMAHYLPKHYRVLILERKLSSDAAIESTGLITTATKNLLAEYTEVEKFIPNKITTIGVVAHNYDDYFFSTTSEPWVFSTDTPQLVRHMATTISANCNIVYGANFEKYTVNHNSDYQVQVDYKVNGENISINTKFVIGADGCRSKVASSNKNLSRNTKLLIGLEKVFFGDIKLGNNPDSTVYHFWFGSFSLGYGGWLSPTVIAGKKALRVGLAKLEDNIKDLNKLHNFIKILKEKKIIFLSDDNPILTFSNFIPIGGPLKNISDDRCLLIGDAAGLCGAFAADGIKGAVVSGRVGARLVDEFLCGDSSALSRFHSEIQKFNKFMTYYRKQILYRFIWDCMKRDRTFMSMYKIIANNKDHFLDQFCDSKDKNKSLLRLVLHWRELPKLIQYGWYLILDFFV